MFATRTKCAAFVTAVSSVHLRLSRLTQRFRNQGETGRTEISSVLRRARNRHFRRVRRHGSAIGMSQSKLTKAAGKSPCRPRLLGAEGLDIPLPAAKSWT